MHLPAGPNYMDTAYDHHLQACCLAMGEDAQAGLEEQKVWGTYKSTPDPCMMEMSKKTHTAQAFRQSNHTQISIGYNPNFKISQIQKEASWRGWNSAFSIKQLKVSQPDLVNRPECTVKTVKVHVADFLQITNLD